MKMDFSISKQTIYGWILLGIGFLMLGLLSGWQKYIGIVPTFIALIIFLKELFRDKNKEPNKQ